MTRHRFGAIPGARLAAGLAAAGVLLLPAITSGASATAATRAPATRAPATRAPASTVPASAVHLVVPTAGGVLRGKAAGAMDEFLGIPYAAPPVGPLRWQPPQPHAHWPGVRQATRYGPHCPQPPSPFGQASTSENCLFLNVFTPTASRPGGHLPVMVWIHGGSLLVGESNDYNPVTLVRHGVIVVTINYRLGALGFLADQALAGSGGSSGDYGLMDQQAALHWVADNVGRFGGDPRNVTIFGESAGGLSVLSQLASPGAAGLFAKAIVESGSYSLAQPSLAQAETAGQAFAATVGCTSHVASCLRRLPVATIVGNENLGGYTPDVDGQVLTRSVGTALAGGQFNRVPVVMGTNRDEWRLFVGLDTLEGAPVTAANYESTIESTLGVPASVAAAIEAEYPLSRYSSPPVAMGAVGTDAIFACHALTLERSLAGFVPTYAYEFSDRNAPERFLPSAGFPYGAAHASEIQYLFRLRKTPEPGPLSPAQQHLAGSMQQDWTSFAKTGVPAQPSAWPQFTSAIHQALTLLPPTPRVSTNFAAEHRCSFWAQLAG